MTAKNPLESVMPNVVAGAIEQVIDSQVATDKKVESLDEQISRGKKAVVDCREMLSLDMRDL